MSSRRELVKGFGEFIGSREWDLLGTITFRQPVSTTAAKKCLRCLFKQLNSKERVFFFKYVICLAFFEREGIRNGVHVHLLVKGIAHCHAKALEDYIMHKRCRRDRCVRDNCTKEQRKSVFGKSVIDAYDPKNFAKYYLAMKYNSDALDDFDVLRINSRYRGRRPSTGRVKYILRSAQRSMLPQLHS